MAVRFSGTRPMVLEAFADLARAEPGIHEHAGLIGFEVGAVAAGTAAENGEFNSHAWTLVAREDAGQIFSMRRV